jgi:hypothetical protein
MWMYDLSIALQSKGLSLFAPAALTSKVVRVDRAHPRAIHTHYFTLGCIRCALLLLRGFAGDEAIVDVEDAVGGLVEDGVVGGDEHADALLVGNGA